MNREIKFRALSSNGKLRYGLPYFRYETDTWFISCSDGWTPSYYNPDKGEETLKLEIDYNTIGQFTGLHDKNGVEVYEGDILEYYELKRYSQQSHFDINPEIDTYTLDKRVSQVTFLDGIFSIDNTDNPVLYIGLHNLKEVKDYCNCFDDDDSDINGNKINESILGIKVIGNIHQNPELIK